MVFDKSVSTELDNLCSLASENKLNYNMVLYAAQLAPLKSLAVSDIVDYLRNNGVLTLIPEYFFRFEGIFGNIMARHFLVAVVMRSDRRIRMPQKSQTGEFAATPSTRI